MIFVYRILFFPVLVILLLKNLSKMLRRGGYAEHLEQRLGGFPHMEKERPRLWIQAVSVGEVNAIGPLLKKLSDEFEIVLTTTTTTAYKIIKAKYRPWLRFFGYFPWDFWWFSRLAWTRIQPDAIILVESELWPEHLHQARQRKVPVFLVNARLSDRSFQRYRKFPKLAEKPFSQLDYILTSSEENYQRIETILSDSKQQFNKECLQNVGNLKFDIETQRLSEPERLQLRKELGFSPDDFVIVGCSTWPGEETLLIELLKRLRNVSDHYKLLLVPRHAERREVILEEIEGSSFCWHQRSRGIANKIVDICLGDTTGELSRLIQVGNLTFIGKSLTPYEGGQSPLDAASAGSPIVYGAYMTNFREICKQLEQAQAAIKVHDEKEAIETLFRLAQSPEECSLLSQRVTRWFHSNQGATEKTYQFIREHLL